MENFTLNCPVEISGLNDDKPYIELTSRLCWLDYMNLNKVGISSKANESLDSLVDMPVVAKINNDGTKFGGHEVFIDDKGEVVFNTSAYGVHTSTYVVEEEVSIPQVGKMTLPCLYAKAKIWKRFANVVDLIKKKFESPEDNNGGLWSSWELQGSEYHIDTFGGKIYDKFQFLSNCIIDVMPAYYDTSKGIAIASKSTFDNELEIAYINDIENLESDKKKTCGDMEDNMEDKMLDDEIDMKKKEEEEEDNMSKKEEKDKKNMAEITMFDLYSKLSQQLDKTCDCWMNLFMVFTESKKIWAYEWNRKSELDYMSFDYIINEDDSVTLSNKKDVKLTVTDVTNGTDSMNSNANVNIQLNLDQTAQLLSVKETKIVELTNVVNELTSELSTKTDALVKVSETITTLEAEIATLKPFKDASDAIAQVEAEKILAEQKESLKNLALKSGFILESELEDEVIKSAIDAIDESTIKVIIANRFIAKLNEKPAEVVAPIIPTIETSTTPDPVTPSATANINLDDEESFDPKSIMASYLKSK